MTGEKNKRAREPRPCCWCGFVGVNLRRQEGYGPDPQPVYYCRDKKACRERVRVACDPDGPKDVVPF